MSELIQKTTTEALEIRCKLNYERLGHNYGDTISRVPFTEVGIIGDYKLSVRYYRTKNTNPSWGYSLTFNKGVVNKGGFTTCQDAIDNCIKVAKLKEEEYSY